MTNFSLSLQEVKELFQDDLPDKYTRLLEDHQHLVNQSRLFKASHHYQD